jgi:hypothetical protein
VEVNDVEAMAPWLPLGCQNLKRKKNKKTPMGGYLGIPGYLYLYGNAGAAQPQCHLLKDDLIERPGNADTDKASQSRTAV